MSNDDFIELHRVTCEEVYLPEDDVVTNLNSISEDAREDILSRIEDHSDLTDLEVVGAFLKLF